MRLKSERTAAQRELQHKRRRYIEARRSGMDRDQAAAEAGVSPSTTYKGYESLHIALKEHRTAPVPPRARPADRWWTEAACATTVDPEVFTILGHGPVYSISPAARAAVRICRRCPVRRECLQEALDSGETRHIRGGLTPAELEYVAAVGLQDLQGVA